MIVVDFRQGGMTAWARERLKILVSMGVSWGAHSLSTVPGTPFALAAFLGFTARSTRLTSCSLTVSVGVLGLGRGGGRAGADVCCCDVSKRAKKQFSSSASDTLRSPVVVVGQPLKLVMS